MKPIGSITIQYYKSPCGYLMLGSYQEKLCLCDWTTEKRKNLIGNKQQRQWHARYELGESETTAKAAGQLDEYFAGQRISFNIPLLFTGTPFQKAMSDELLKIPYGTTVSYLELAKRLGQKDIYRMKAAVNNANFISIFVPCHRVIGDNQELAGYAGGLQAKKLLLDLERKAVQM